ncbi:MAG TPA: thrombospondin type 3 repeat-containing protein [Candidatus Polarisedimenticolia bacterium]|nr:thrombospondin type 3 repeat-containing protein [Candidatus Polarisedimenticolia bacterium]
MVESPGPDGNLATAADNRFYDGNRYDGGRNNANFDQWSLGRTSTTPVEKHDKRNNTEAVHLSADTNIDFLFDESPLYTGLWRVTVKRGLGGAIAGQITITAPTVGQDPDQNEDDNNNGRLDAGEDNNANGLLDQLGQPYSLVVSGPVFLAEAAPPAGPSIFPSSMVSWDANRYGCSSNARLLVLDTTGTATPANVQSSTSYLVQNAAGATTDSESSFTYAAGAATGSFTSAAIPVRLGGPAVANNGILEADTGSLISATYARLGQAAVTAKALVSCSPDLIQGAFTAFAGNALGNQFAVAGGCDNDDNLDAGEVVTYGIALQNRSRVNNYADLVATLTPSGPGAAAIRVLDSPKNMGSFPGNGVNGVFFHVFVDPTIANGLAVANRVVDMTLSLDSLVRGTRISRQTYTFKHAINSDRQEFFYSTDFPNGGRQVRDINRNLVVDPPDTTDPFLGFIVTREDVTFSSLFSGTGAPVGQFTNQLGEDLDNNGIFSGVERNVVPDVDGGGVAILNKGVLNSNNPADPLHRVPWNFDNNNGGWIPFRHPGSNAAGVNVNPLWEYKTSGLCGFQSTGGLNKFGIWHTGDGDPTTPGGAATACDNHTQPNDPNTPEKVELLMDVLESPIVAKVNQNNDARGFAFTVEFQRFAYNENIQLNDGYAGGGVNIDNDIDSDNANSLLGQQMDSYYTRRTGGWPYGMFRDAGSYFPGDGIDPATTAPFQRTFGPFTNPNASVNLDGDETGFSGHTQDTNADSSTPIPTTIPDFLAYPVPNAPVIGICDGGTQNDDTCDPGNGADPCIVGGGVCTAAVNTVNGPVRNWDATLIGYEGGFASLIDNGPQENFYFFFPGGASNRWQIGVGFWAMEGTAGDTDYGKSMDDAVFEWKEYHPQDEAALGAQPACTRFNNASLNFPQGGQCATLTADRTSLYECDEGMEITVYDAKCRTIGAGNTVPVGGACTTNTPCGAGGLCSATLPSVQVQVVTDTDSVPVAAAGGQVRFPNAKLYTLNAVPGPGNAGLFRGTIIFSTTTNDPNHAYTNPGSDGVFSVYYHDPICDGDFDGQAGEDNFNNVDGDGVADASDNCPQLYNPLQEDTDADGFGTFCDNCPTVDNADQGDANADGIGDACEFDDVDGDGLPNDADNCPDNRNPNQADIEADGRGDLCDTLKTQGVTFGTSAGAADCVSGLCTVPGDARGDACVTDEDCIRSCRTNICTQGNNGSAGGAQCYGGPNDGNACAPGGTDCGICVGGPTPGAPCAVAATCGAGGACNVGVCFNNFVSPTPKIGQACATHADCYNDLDRDGDGIVDALDNCTIADNGPLQGPNIQTDSDGDGLGNVCDGDCANAVEVFRCRANGVACPVPESNQAACANAFGLGNVCGFYVQNSGSCSTVDDDFDADNIGDLGDSCATVFNAAIIAGTDRQRDSDRDGIGDACDPAGTFDDAQDGLPDDVVAFNGNIVCRTQPLANLAILAADYRDTDGDIDAFPDTGENGRIRLTLRNLGPNLTDATVVLTSSDSDVACITKPTLLVPADPGNTPPQALGQWQNGVTRVLGDFVNNNPGFQFIASAGLNYTGPPAPIPTTNFCITVVANETLGTASPFCFSLLADLDPPGGPQPAFTLGNDGLNGTADDGTLVENFDVDKNGDGQITVKDTFLQATAPGTFRGYCSNAPNTTCQTDNDCGGAPALCYMGSYIRGDATGVAVGTVAATSCGGYDTYGGANTYCQLDPDFPMDWHVHCSPGAVNCPNLETGTCVGGCSYATPVGGQKSHSGSNSLHMGAHFDPADNLAGDTTHFRTLQGYQSGPMNLALFPRPGDMELSFYHIARLMDNNGVGPNNERQCVDCGDVQIQLDGDGGANVDNWGFWDKLVPFQNVYDHKPNAFSVFGGYYCEFTPTDTGTAPPNPRGVHETTCYPLGTWSHCGSTIGTVATATVDCAGPGEVDATGVGVWVQTKFNLSGYVGQRVRLRWIAESWTFDENSSNYFEIGGTWAATQQDDGWWLDDIRITGTIQSQFTPNPDLAPSPGAICPSDPCNQALGDGGTNVVLNITDLNGNVLDGVTTFPFAGQSIRVSAIDSTNPGGCMNGVLEYEFSKDGVVKQAFGPKSFYLDAPESAANYGCRARCSTDFTCTSLVGGSIAVNPYTGDGSDAIFANPPNQSLGVRYFRGTCTAGPNPLGGCNEAADCGVGGACSVTAATGDDTTRYSVVTNAGGLPNGLVDLYRGTVATAKGSRNGQIWLLNHTDGAAFVQHLAFVANNPPGKQFANTLNQATDVNPAVGAVQYYLAVGHAPGGNSVNALGCANPGICGNAGWCSLGASAGAPCNVAGDCPGGACTIRTTFCTTDGGSGDVGGCARHQVCVGGTNAGNLCLAAGDCPGGTCPAIPASPAGTCFSVQSGMPSSGCLPPGSAKRLVDQAVVLAP